MDRGAWWATVPGVTKSQTQLSNATIIYVIRIIIYICYMYIIICIIYIICYNYIVVIIVFLVVDLPYCASFYCTAKRISHTHTWVCQVALVVKNLPIGAGDVRDTGLIPGSRRSPVGENGTPLQCSCLENPPHGQKSLVDYGS